MAKKKSRSKLIWGIILIAIGLLAFRWAFPLLLILVGAYLLYKYYQENPPKKK